MHKAPAKVKSSDYPTCKKVEHFDNGMLLEGDALEILSDKQNHNTVRLVVTSPPYGKAKDEFYPALGFEDSLPYYDAIDDVTKDDSHLILNLANTRVGGFSTITSQETLIYIVKNTGFNFVQEITWIKSGARTTENCFGQITEPIYWLKKGDPWFHIPTIATNEKEEGNKWKMPPNVLELDVGSKKTDLANIKHSAKFPGSFAENMISMFSQEDDLVLDPFSGSGTTCDEAMKLGRKFLGIDVVTKHMEGACFRLRETEKTLKKQKRNSKKIASKPIVIETQLDKQPNVPGLELASESLKRSIEIQTGTRH